MGPDPPQQTAAPTEAAQWFELELVFGLGALNLGVLLISGIAVSAVVWIIVEGLKARGLESTRRRQWAPVIVSEAISIWLFPLCLEGVNPNHTLPLWAAIVLGIVLGLVGGFGARGAHRYAEGLMRALFGWALGKLEREEHS